MAMLSDFLKSLDDSGGIPQQPMSGGGGGSGGSYWGNAPEWQKLDDTTKAAVMAYLEADQKGGKVDLGSASNALGAMINRADKEGVPLGQHVSGKIYQPTIEPAQRARVEQALQSPEVAELKQMAADRLAGKRDDWVNGATHFLAPEKTMLALEAREPGKYKNWGPRGQNWTGYDTNTGEYRGVVMRDASHAFLAPSGAHSAKFGAQSPNEGMDGAPAPPVPQINPGMVASADGTPKPITFGSLASNAGQSEASDLASLKSVLAGAQKVMGRRDTSAASPEQEAGDHLQISAPRVAGADLGRIMAILQKRKPLGSMGA